MAKKRSAKPPQEPQPGPLFDFKAFGRVVKAKRTACMETREQACEALGISQRFLANIENSGQPASVHVVCRLANRYEISMDQFFFPDKSGDKSPCRQQIDFLLDHLSERDLGILLATAEQMARSVEKSTAEADMEQGEWGTT